MFMKVNFHLFIVILLCNFFVKIGTADDFENEVSDDSPVASPSNDSTIIPKMTYLNDTHRQLTCSDNQFSCGPPDNRCIFNTWVCNGNSDCPDGKDEQNCTTSTSDSGSTTNQSHYNESEARGNNTCLDRQFSCEPPDNSCIPRIWVCDGDFDCRGGSDEKNCTSSSESGSTTNQSHSNENESNTCPSHQVSCGPPDYICIPQTWVCDGDFDCRGGNDEKNCRCLDDKFSCGPPNNRCIFNAWVCDGDSDCPNGEDERNCTSISDSGSKTNQSHSNEDESRRNSICLDDEFSCGSPDNRCISNSWICDGENDCPDGKDERNCISISNKNETCPEWMFLCFNKKCIPYWWKCDNEVDCDDGSDEIGCNSNTNLTTTLAP